MLLTHGDWARQTSDLITNLHVLNAQEHALPVLAGYADNWAEMLHGVDLLEAALDDLNEGISLYKLEKLAEYKENLVAAKAVMADVGLSAKHFASHNRFLVARAWCYLAAQQAPKLALRARIIEWEMRAHAQNTRYP